MLRILIVFAIILLTERGEVWAHFLFAHMVRDDNSKVELHFAESAWDFSSNARMVGLMETARTWTVDGNPIQCLARPYGMHAPLSDGATAVCSEFTYGLMNRGGAFLLRYHAKGVAGWEAAAAPSNLEAEVVAEATNDDHVILTVLFRGEAVAGAELLVPGSGLDTVTHTTDADGRVTIPRPTTPLLAFRAMVPEERSGEHDGKAYDLVRHYTTLTINDASSATSGSDGLAWSVLHDARDLCGEFMPAPTQWSGIIRGTLDGRPIDCEITHRNNAMHVTGDPDVTALIDPLPDPAAQDGPVVFATERDAGSGSTIHLPESGLTYSVRDRRIMAVEHRSGDQARRVDVLEWTPANDGRIIATKIVMTEYADDGIGHVSIVERKHTAPHGGHVPKSHAGIRLNGAESSTPISLTISGISSK